MSMDFSGGSALVINTEFLANHAASGSWERLQALFKEDGYLTEAEGLDTLWRLVERSTYGLGDLSYEPAEGTPLWNDLQAFDVYGNPPLPREQQYIDEFEALIKEFAESTKVGGSQLQLYIANHNSDDEGSSYDEVDGVYFGVTFETAYARTPAADILFTNNDLEWCNFVQLG